jgi:hypothetical protein
MTDAGMGATGWNFHFAKFWSVTGEMTLTRGVQSVTPNVIREEHLSDPTFPFSLPGQRLSCFIAMG